MRAILIFLLAITGLSLALPAAEEPQQILLHEGPDLTTPGLLEKEVLTYRKEFFVDAALLAKQERFSMPPSGQLPLAAEKAIELAIATVDTRAVAALQSGGMSSSTISSKLSPAAMRSTE